MVINKINNPSDLKTLKLDDLNELAGEMRELIINKVNTIGGHMSPNLGIVETTIALHYVFNSPIDKIIYDVSHQCYSHKIITGRKDGFTNPSEYLKYTGYTAPEECEHDLFKIGHTSTSVSLACGVAKARDLKGEKGNVIALIGDGSLSGGEALEGLDNAGTFKSNFIIIVNDNEMSIAENHGGLYENLRALRESNGQAEPNLFKAFGLDYIFLKEGNDIQKLIETFEKVKDVDHPIVVHICTEKGHGLKQAEENKEMFHWVMPGILDEKSNATQADTYASVALDYMLKKAKEDKTFVTVTAGTPGVFGFNSKIREEFGEHYTDVGIAEEHAVAYCSALAKCGAKPIFNVMSSFVQRTYDQLSQDLCLNNSPITMLVHWGGISGADATHLCTFDIPLISNIPNMVYLAPTNKEEFLNMLSWSVDQTQCPVAIRVPNGELISTGIEDKTDYSILNKFKITQNGEKIAVLGLGNFYNLACEVAKEIKSKLGFDATIINPIYMTGIDEELLNKLKENHEVVITLEDGVLDGGFGEKIARFYGNSNVKVLNYGAKKEFTDRIPLQELYNRYRLTKELILEDLESIKA